MGNNRKRWTKEQIENFLRQNTGMMDEACKRLASTLFNKDIVNTIINCDPEDYTKRTE